MKQQINLQFSIGDHVFAYISGKVTDLPIRSIVTAITIFKDETFYYIEDSPHPIRESLLVLAYGDPENFIFEVKDKAHIPDGYKEQFDYCKSGVYVNHGSIGLTIPDGHMKKLSKDKDRLVIEVLPIK